MYDVGRSGLITPVALQVDELKSVQRTLVSEVAQMDNVCLTNQLPFLDSCRIESDLVTACVILHQQLLSITPAHQLLGITPARQLLDITPAREMVDCGFVPISCCTDAKRCTN